MKPLVMNLSNQKNQHIVWLDVVRFIAMFTVVCCHCTDPFNFYPGTAPNIGEIKLWGAIYGSVLRPCVPLFPGPAQVRCLKLRRALVACVHAFSVLLHPVRRLEPHETPGAMRQARGEHEPLRSSEKARA